MVEKMLEDRPVLENLFAQLNERGIEAHTDFMCCSSCGVDAIEKDQFVFWNSQMDESAFNHGQTIDEYFDDEDFDEEGEYTGLEEKMEGLPRGPKLLSPLFLQHDGSEDTFNTMLEVFEGSGYILDWNYDPDTTVRLSTSRIDTHKEVEAIENHANALGAAILFGDELDEDDVREQIKAIRIHLEFIEDKL